MREKPFGKFQQKWQQSLHRPKSSLQNESDKVLMKMTVAVVKMVLIWTKWFWMEEFLHTFPFETNRVAMIHDVYYCQWFLGQSKCDLYGNPSNQNNNNLLLSKINVEMSKWFFTFQIVSTRSALKKYQNDLEMLKWFFILYMSCDSSLIVLREIGNYYNHLKD